MLMFGQCRWMDQGAHGGRVYDCVFDVSHVFVIFSCIWIMSCILYFVLMYSAFASHKTVNILTIDQLNSNRTRTAITTYFVYLLAAIVGAN